MNPFLIFGQTVFMNFRSLPIVLSLFFGFLLQAQDSTITGERKSHQIRTLNTRYKTIDSNIRPTEYDRFNIFNDKRPYYYDNGNLAAKGHYKAWQFNKPASLLKDFGNLGYQNIFRTIYNVPILEVKSPVAELHYMTTYRQGSHFGGYFSQNVRPNFNYYLGYVRTHSQGKFLRQETKFDNFDWSMNYRSKDNKYKFLFILIWQKARNEENGGLSNSDDFVNNIESKNELYSVRLFDSRGTSRKTEVMFNQQYMLASTDSTNLSGLAVYHKFSFKDKYHLFTSTDTAFKNFYFADNAKDSTRFQNIYNEGGLKWDINAKYLQSINGGVYFNAHNYKGEYLKRNGNEIGLVLNFNGLSGDKFFWEADGQYLIGNKSAAMVNLKANYAFNNSQLGAYALAQSLQPSYFEESYISNNFIWAQNFDKNKNKSELGVNYSYQNWFKIEGSLSNLSSWIIMNTQAVPEQLTENITMANANVYLHLFSKHAVKWDVNTAFNKMINGADFYRLPPLALESKLFWDYSSFKNALTGQFGLSLKYFSRYKANAYNPSNGTYYLQNDTEIGNFVYLNAYAIVKIKTLRVFLVLENILEGIVPYDYFSSPGYVLNDRTFRIGAKWRFFN